MYAMVRKISKIMYVICFYWQGDRWQTPSYVEPADHENLQQKNMNRLGVVESTLPPRYVNNLYRGVKRYADREFTFICFTNEKLKGLDPNIEIRKFPMCTLDGVLPRLYMFSEEAGLFGHQVLCLDIDILVVGSLKDLMSYDGTFCARSKFKHGEEYKLDGDVMSFKANKETEALFWSPFVKDVERAVEFTQGRERYWVRYVANDIADRWDTFAPKQVLSYKNHIENGIVPEQAAIISCHGVPRPHQIRSGWIKPYWR